jgi:hypothetical protein
MSLSNMRRDGSLVYYGDTIEHKMFIRGISSWIKNRGSLQFQRPVNPTFYTGNPNYYNLLIKMNDLMRQYNIPFQQESHSSQTDRWMTMKDIERQMDMRLSRGAYKDLIFKLDQLSKYSGILYCDFKH